MLNKKLKLKASIWGDIDWCFLSLDETKKDIKKGMLEIANSEIKDIEKDIKKIERRIEKYESI